MQVAAGPRLPLPCYRVSLLPGHLVHSLLCSFMSDIFILIFFFFFATDIFPRRPELRNSVAHEKHVPTG